MPHSAFDNPIFDQASHELAVSGPFFPEGDVLGPVAVRFVLFQEPPHGSTDDPLLLHGVAIWDGTGPWQGSVSLTDAEVRKLRADTIRGIAAAVVVRPANPQNPPPDPPPPDPDPPYMDTITWCVARTVVFQ